MTTRNYQKHTSSNRLQKWLIDNFYKAVLDSLRDIKVERVLDVGCGEGFGLKRVKTNNIGHYHEGLDISQQAIKLGKKLHPKIKFTLGNIYQLPYEDNSFDLILCNEVLEHLTEPGKALKEIVRVGRKHYLISVPNEPWFRTANLLRLKNLSRLGNDPEHIQNWSKKIFLILLKKIGLKPMLVKLPFPWIIVLAEV